MEKHDNVIIHIDMDCFYAQVEMLHDPNLRDKPLGIKQKQCIVTSNYEARKFGVNKLVSVTKALKLCPQLVMVNGEDLTKYREMSEKIHSTLKRFTTLVEKLGMDENFLDITNLVKERAIETNIDQLETIGHVFEAEDNEEFEECDCGCKERLRIGSCIAKEIRDTLKLELNITCCAGIAHNKLLAKLISGTHKPNQQTTLFPWNVMDLMDTIKTPKNIPGIGWKMAEKLSSKNINTMSDLQNSKVSDLGFLGKDAQKIKNLSFGIDMCPVVPFEKVKSISTEDSFKQCNTLQECEAKIKEILLKLCPRVVQDGRIPGTITLTVRKKKPGITEQRRESQQCKIPVQIIQNISENNIDEVTEKLLPLVMPMLNNLVGLEFCLTLICVTFSKLSDANENPASIENFFEKLEQPITSQPMQGSSNQINLEKVSTPKSSRSNNSILAYVQKEARFSPTSTSKGDVTKRSSNLDSSSSKRFKADQKSSKNPTITSYFALPNNIDMSTFKELPSEIQNELIREWNSTRN